MTMQRKSKVIRKFQYGLNWHVRTPDNKSLNLNTEEAADIILDLWERVSQLESKLKKRQRRAKQRRQPDNN